MFHHRVFARLAGLVADRKPGRSDAGFGMIEIVVSMFMLALLAMSFLPVLYNGLTAAASNARLATATQLVNQSIELARGGFASCQELQTFVGIAVTREDGRGTTLQATRSLPDGCTPNDGLPERVVVSVAPVGSPSDELARATTHVLIGG